MPLAQPGPGLRDPRSGIASGHGGRASTDFFDAGEPSSFFSASACRFSTGGSGRGAAASTSIPLPPVCPPHCSSTQSVKTRAGREYRSTTSGPLCKRTTPPAKSPPSPPAATNSRGQHPALHWPEQPALLAPSSPLFLFPTPCSCHRFLLYILHRCRPRAALAPLADAPVDRAPRMGPMRQREAQDRVPLSSGRVRQSAKHRAAPARHGLPPFICER